MNTTPVNITNLLHQASGDHVIRRGDDQRWRYAAVPLYVYDVEVYPNLFVVSFYDGRDHVTFNHEELPELRKWLDDLNDKAGVLVGFNNAHYDDAILRYATDRPETIRPNDIYMRSRFLLADDLDAVGKKNRRKLLDQTHGWKLSIDLMQVIGPRFGSLKEWACRFGEPIVSESSVPFDQDVPNDAIAAVVLYNRSDVMVTEKLMVRHLSQIDIRHEMETGLGLGRRVYVESEASIAERYLTVRYCNATGLTGEDLRRMAGMQEIKQKREYAVGSFFPVGAKASTNAYQQVLAALANDHIERALDGRLNRRSELVGNQCTIDGVSLVFSCGGLHSDDEPGDFASDDERTILDVDVTSYYPSIMVGHKIHPRQTMETFIRLLDDLREMRMTAKKSGNSRRADCLKTIINSLTGRMNYEYSAFYDLSAYLRLIITGQVLLTLLIEAVSLAGARVLSVNTDGLIMLVPTKHAAEVQQALCRWEEDHRLTLERKSYQRYLRSSVNDYIAIETTSDYVVPAKVKTKGAFGDGVKNASARVIKRAVAHNLVTGGSVRSFIESHAAADDFLLYTRGKAGTYFSHGGHLIGRTVRWYAGQGDGVGTIKRHTRLGDAGTTIPDGAMARLANDLPHNYAKQDLHGLNLDFYIAQAEKLLSLSGSSEQIDRGTTQARQLQEMGLTLLPQRNHRNPHGVSLNDLDTITGLQDRRCDVWGVVTGRETATMVLDLDKPERLDEELRAILMNAPTLTTWHGSGSANDVRAGRKRGAVIYFYDGGDSRIHTANDKGFVDRYGFELAYGKKVQTVIGPHRSAGDVYEQHSAPTEAPAELIEYLTLRNRSSRCRPVTDQDDSIIPDSTMELLRQAVDSVTRPGWGTFCSRPWRCVTGETPGHDKPRPLNVWLRNGRVCARTFHATFPCSSFRNRVQAELDRLMAAHPDTGTTRPMDPADRLEQLSDEQARIATDCSEAFQRITRIGVIEAPTGSGKTHQCAVRAIEVHDSDGYIVVVAQDKEALHQLRQYLTGLWVAGGREPEELKSEVIVAGERNEEEGDEADDDGGPQGENGSKKSRPHGVKKSTRIVLTHHAYFSRKPVTKDLYSVTRWVKEHHAEVLLDEIDLFIERQNCGYELDARYMLIGGTATGSYRAAGHCPSHRGSFRCRHCPKRSATRVVQCHSHLEVRQRGGTLPSQFDSMAAEEFTIARNEIPIESTVALPALNMQVHKLMQTPGYLESRSFDRKSAEAEEEEANLPEPEKFRRFQRDLIECSFRPTQVEPLPTNEDGVLVNEDPNLLAQRAPEEDKARLDSDRACKWRFPYFTCGVRTLLLYDRAPLHFIVRHASRLIMMSATITEEQVEFLRSCADGHTLERHAIPAPTYSPLQRVIIIAHEGRLYWDESLGKKAAALLGIDEDPGLSNRTVIERLGNALSKINRKPVIFLPTKKAAGAVFGKIRERGWSYFCEGVYESRSDLPVTESAQTDGSRALLSYARSSLGTGKNLSDFRVVVVDGSVDRPHFLFNPSSATESDYLRAQEQDRLRIVTQNVGRIMRGEGTKVVFVTGISRPQVEALARRLEKLTKEPAQIWCTPDDHLGALATVVASAQAERLVVKESPAEPEKQRSQMSRKQRVIADHNAEQATPVSDVISPAFLNKFDQAVTAFMGKKSKRQVLRMVNFSRMSATEQFLFRLTAVAAGIEPWQDAKGRGKDLVTS